MENGYFVEEGIDIELEYNFNEVDGVDRIAVNDLQFGIISGEQVIIGRGAEKPLVYVYEWYHDFPVGIAAPADSGIETPEDLLDQKIGIPGPYGASYIGFRAILAAGGLDDLDVEAESIGFTAPESLCENRVDAATVYINNEPLIVENNCFPVTVLAVSDYVELVSNGLVTNEETIENNPELVAGMARALQRGILDTIADPDAAFDMSLPYMPDLAEENYELERAVLENTLLLWESDNPGATTPERWENMQTVLLDIGFINTPLEDLSAAYTLDFIPQTEE
jgi:NitT/TauT family transport system substrate-binding protein